MFWEFFLRKIKFKIFFGEYFGKTSSGIRRRVIRFSEERHVVISLRGSDGLIWIATSFLWDNRTTGHGIRLTHLHENNKLFLYEKLDTFREFDGFFFRFSKKVMHSNITYLLIDKFLYWCTSRKFDIKI